MDFYYNQWGYFVFFYFKSNFIRICIVKVSQTLFFLFDLDIYIYIYIYIKRDIYHRDIIESLNAMTLSNLLKYWLCDNGNLVLLWISRMLRTRRQCMKVFSKKNIEQNKCEQVDFLQIRQFFIAEMGKVSNEI